MNDGLNLLKSKIEVVNILNLEEKYNLRLPPIYRLLATYLELGEFNYDKYLANKYSESFALTGVYYEPKGLGENNIGITGLYPIERVFESYKNLSGYTDDDIDRGFIKVADIGYGGGIFIGTKEDLIDNVFLHSWEREPQYELLASNIFEFIKNIKVFELPEDELIEAKYSQLYKNYGEDFWRVREENI